MKSKQPESRRSPGQDHTGKQKLQNSKQQKEIKKKILEIIASHNDYCKCKLCNKTREILQATLKKSKTANELNEFYKILKGGV